VTRTRLVLLLVLAAGGLAWLVERLIVTDAEAIESTVERLAAHASTGRWADFEALLSDDFDSPWGDKGKFPKAVADLMKRFDVKTAAVTCGQITVRGDRGAAAVTVRGSGAAAGFPVPGRVDLVKTSDGWRVEAVTSDLDASGWRRVR